MSSFFPSDSSSVLQQDVNYIPANIDKNNALKNCNTDGLSVNYANHSTSQSSFFPTTNLVNNTHSNSNVDFSLLRSASGTSSPLMNKSMLLQRSSFFIDQLNKNNNNCAPISNNQVASPMLATPLPSTLNSVPNTIPFMNTTTTATTITDDNNNNNNNNITNGPITSVTTSINNTVVDSGSNVSTPKLNNNVASFNQFGHSISYPQQVDTQSLHTPSSLSNLNWKNQINASNNYVDNSSSNLFPSRSHTPIIQNPHQQQPILNSPVITNFNNNSTLITQPFLQGQTVSSISQHPLKLKKHLEQIRLISQWKYLDFNGDLQGPFPSSNMTSWFQCGYFNSTLRICRVFSKDDPPFLILPFGITNEAFMPLGHLCVCTNNSVDPFGSFDLIISAFVTQFKENQTADDIVGSRDYTYAELLNWKDPKDGSYYREISVLYPIQRKYKEELIDWPAPEILIEKTEKNQEDPKADQALESQDSVYSENEITQQQEGASLPTDTMAEIKDESVNVEAANLKIITKTENEVEKDENKTNKNSIGKPKLFEKSIDDIVAEIGETKFIEEDNDDNHKKKKKTKKSKKKKTKKSKEKSPSPKVSNKNDDVAKDVDIESQLELTEDFDEDTEEQPVSLAPWAKVSQKKQQAPKETFLDVQKRETEMFREKEKKLKEENTRRLKQTILNMNKEEEIKKKSDITNIARWGSTDFQKPKEPKKGIVSFEEQMKIDLQNSNFIKEQQRLWEEATRAAAKNSSTPSTSSSSSFAKTTSANNAANSAGSSWVTVSSKKTVTPVKSQQQIVKQHTNVITPDKLRSSSMNNTPSASLSNGGSVVSYLGNGTNSNELARKSQRHDFLSWCNSRLKLNDGVRVNDILEVLLSLPSGDESKEIITDTINSNSSVMNGSRFSVEFLKRRKLVEQNTTDPLSWTEALSLFNAGKDTDWDFQVVSSKKKKKSTR